MLIAWRNDTDSAVILKLNFVLSVYPNEIPVSLSVSEFHTGCNYGNDSSFEFSLFM